jgi:hypothetical protein
MDLLAAIVIASILFHRGHLHLSERRRLRAMQRLLALHPPAPSYDSPSPHQLLGDIARPLKARRAE